VLPIPEVLVELARAHRLVVAVSDCGRHGGFGSALATVLRDAECDVPLRDLALPQRFLDHGSRADVLHAAGLTAQDVARRVTEWAAAALPTGADSISGEPAPSEEEAR
jgi:1-deoxy-D-xylulose-5-phosphate synthase